MFNLTMYFPLKKRSAIYYVDIDGWIKGLFIQFEAESVRTLDVSSSQQL